MKIKGFILFVFSINSIAYAQGVISGKIFGNDIETIEIYEPINGFCNNQEILLPQNKITLNTKSFKKKFFLDKPNFIVIVVRNNSFYLFVEPNDSIDICINIDSIDKESFYKKVKIIGNNAAGNMLFNYFNFYPGEKFGSFSTSLINYKFSKTYDLNLLDRALIKIIRPFDSLYQKNKISSSFNKILHQQITGILLVEYFKKYYSNNLTPKQILANLKFVEKIYLRFNLKNLILQNGIFSSSMAYWYYSFVSKTHSRNYTIEDSILYIGGKKLFIHSDFVPWLFAPKKKAEYYWGTNIIGLNKMFPNEDYNNVKRSYLLLYPKSYLRSYLGIDLINPKSNFIDTTDYDFFDTHKIKNFDSLLYQLKGNNILIDFWATWCMPCRMEFNLYNKVVDSFCLKYKINRLYIALEKQDNLKLYKNIVFSYNLTGSHFRVNNEHILKEICQTFYNDPQNYELPHFALVNYKGEIVNKKAPRLSETKELFSEMIEKFGLITNDVMLPLKKEK